MPSRFEKYRENRKENLSSQSPVSSTAIAAISFLSILALASKDKIVIDVSILILCIWVLKIASPVIRKLSENFSGIAADAIFFLALFIPHVPSMLLMNWSTNVLRFDIYAPVVFGVGLVFFCVANLNQMKVYLSPIFSMISSSKLVGTKVLYSSNILLSAISQEILYRGLLFSILLSIGIVQTIIISSVLFLLEHVINRWSGRDFNIKEYIKQLVLSIACCLVYWLSDLNLLLPILLHLGYNFSTAIIDFIPRNLKNAYESY